MKRYYIFHCTSTMMFREIRIQPRRCMGYVEANSLDQAYKLSQNILDPWQYWNKTDPCRSTSIGDVIQCDNEFHMVSFIGFKIIEQAYQINPELDFSL